MGVKESERKESMEGYIWVKSGHFVNIFEDGYFFAALKKDDISLNKARKKTVLL